MEKNEEYIKYLSELHNEKIKEQTKKIKKKKSKKDKKKKKKSKKRYFFFKYHIKYWTLGKILHQVILFQVKVTLQDHLLNHD